MSTSIIKFTRYFHKISQLNVLIIPEKRFFLKQNKKIYHNIFQLNSFFYHFSIKITFG